MSSMSALNTALSSLYAQRRGLDVTGNNIANVNTEGYTRQRVEMVANSGPLAPAVWSVWNGVGQGVNVTGTARLNDQFLDLRSTQEHATQGFLTTSQTILSRIEMGFGEPSELGLGAQINDFYAGWDDVANNPTDLAARNALLELAGTLTTNLNGTARSLDTLREDLTEQLQAQITNVNNMARAIAELNKNIVNSTNSGLSPTDLMDQRDLLVSKLSDTLGITFKNSANGAIDVYVGGTALVRGSQSEALRVDVSSTGTASIAWAKDGYPADVSGGSASALLTGVNDTIVKYRTNLDEVANRLRTLVNGVHEDGQGLDGQSGRPFFEGTDAAGALGIKVTDEMKRYPDRIGAGAIGGGTADGSNAARLAALVGHKSGAAGTYLEGDGPDLMYRSMIVGLGVETQAVNRRVDIQFEITRQVDAMRDAQAGVNLDEEMVNMLTYQRAYDAAARYMTAVDQMLDKLINGTGLVGR